MNSFLYDIYLIGQFGIRSGMLHFDEQNSVLSGELTLGKKVAYFDSVSLDGERYSFHTHLHTSSGDLTCDAIFYHTDKQLIGGVITPRGCWELTGEELYHKTDGPPCIHYGGTGLDTIPNNYI